MSEPVINMAGELVMLGPMERAQIPVYQRWFNDFETLRTQGEPLPGPGTLETVTRWYEEYVLGSDTTAWFTIYERGTGRPVGWTELKDIDHHHGTAEYAIMIGEPDAIPGNLLDLQGEAVKPELTGVWMVTEARHHLHLKDPSAVGAAATYYATATVSRNSSDALILRDRSLPRVDDACTLMGGRWVAANRRDVLL